jgi:hypothetical protein
MFSLALPIALAAKWESNPRPSEPQKIRGFTDDYDTSSGCMWSSYDRLWFPRPDEQEN